MPDRFVGERGGRYGPPGHSAPREDAPRMRKERETKEDGRYIIFYTFEEEEAGEG